MAGYVGAGGLGDYAITWGYNYGHYDIIWVSVLFVTSSCRSFSLPAISSQNGFPIKPIQKGLYFQ